MLEVHSELKELLASLDDTQAPANIATYQNVYIRFRGLVVNAGEHNKVYQQWAQQYLPDVNDEAGEVVKLHQSMEELQADITAFIRFIERTEGV